MTHSAEKLTQTWAYVVIIVVIIISSPTAKTLIIPITVESRGPINRDALQFLSELGKRLVETTGDVRASSFWFQRISVVVQRFNSVLLHDDGFIDDDRPEYRCTTKTNLCNFCNLLSHQGFSPGLK